MVSDESRKLCFALLLVIKLTVFINLRKDREQNNHADKSNEKFKICAL